MSEFLVPIAISSQLDVTGEERIHAAKYELVVRPLFFGIQGDLQDAEVGEDEEFEYTVTGGEGPFSYELTDGALPDGLTLDEDTGVISGTYTTDGEFSWQITVTDSTNNTAIVNDSSQVVPGMSLLGDVADVAIEAPVATFLETFTDDLTGWSVFSGDAAGFSIVTDDYGKACQAEPGAHTNDAITEPVNEGQFRNVRAKFKVTAVDDDDYGVLEFRDAANNPVFYFFAGRQLVTDPLRRPIVGFVDDPGGVGIPIGAAGVDLDTWYEMVADYDPDALTFSVSVTNLDTEVLLGSVDVSVTARTPIDKVVIRTENGVGSGTVLWDDIEINYAGDNAFADDQYTAVNAIGPVVFTISEGALPTGLSMDTDGHVTGVFEALGSFSWTVLATDSMARTAELEDSCEVTAL